MTEKILSAGDPIECRCTKCRKITNHIVIAMADSIPAKVQCNTCDGQHKYRKPAAPRKPAARRTVDPKIAEQKEWEKLQPDMNSKDAKKYSMTDTYKVGALLKHTSFGIGVVQRHAGPRKIEVLFQDGKKIMRCQ